MKKFNHFAESLLTVVFILLAGIVPLVGIIVAPMNPNINVNISTPIFVTAFLLMEICPIYKLLRYGFETIEIQSDLIVMKRPFGKKILIRKEDIHSITEQKVKMDIDITGSGICNAYIIKDQKNVIEIYIGKKRDSITQCLKESAYL